MNQFPAAGVVALARTSHDDEAVQSLKTATCNNSAMKP
jgi:hypothetical protein